jgi:beta-galactosidase
MDANWRFAFGHPFDPAKDFEHGTGYFSYFAKAGYGDGPAAATFNDSAWRLLDLPHDWAVEAPFASGASPSHGYKAVGRGFPERSVGWYRKTFSLPASDLGRRIGVEFDGVFRDSVVWVNGFYLGRQPSGYTSFRYDLTDYLNYGGENTIAVRVDATMEEGWFYEGAGIYRHVWMTKTRPVHVAHWGTFVTSAVQGDSAEVTARTNVDNEGGDDATLDIEQRIEDAAGGAVAEGAARNVVVAAGATGEFSCAISVAHARLWSLESPTLYRLVTTLRSAGAVVDRYETPFGIRTVSFDPDRGFFLNGRRVEIKGTNNHQDIAGVGVAMPDALQDFRIARLKEMGCNALRCSHNPPAPELLDACDRLGLLVLDENRLMGPSPEQMGQLESMIRRDRNHPSVILWSLGNEEWAIEGNIKGARIAASMQAFAQRLDPTRRTTVANSGGWGGISSVIDLVGYNYIKQSDTDKQHADYPRQPGVGTEESTTRQTRGAYVDDPRGGHLAPLMDASSGGNMELGWQHYAARPFLSGLFYWTGFDYRGEPNPYDWPQVSSQSGILDLCGFPKDGAYYLKAWWAGEPVVHIFPHWNWPGRVGQKIDVWCYSNCDEVELTLNGRSLGAKPMPRNAHLEWSVAYEPGVLEARGSTGGRVVATGRVETTGEPTAIALAPDRASIRADGEDVAVFTVTALDAKGRLVPTADNLVSFKVAGGRIIGVGNGDPSSHEADRFVDGYGLLTIGDWRGRIAPAGTAAPSAPESLPPLPRLGNWKAHLPKPGEVYDLSGTFAVDAVAPGVEWHLFLPALGVRATLWLNGRELARDLDTSTNGPSLRLDPGRLVAGPNRIQLLVAPYGDGKNHMPELTRLGAVRVVTPAPQWQRRLFNGLAQVIVQSARDPGIVRLTAQAQGLAPGDSEVTLQSAAPRPAVP